jgi:SNF2 family DNA or RNA helicase
MRQPSDLRLYQQRISTHLYEHAEALCVVRPGAGKTIAALTAIVELLRDEVIRQALVIAPKRVARSVWPEEIAAWAHTKGLTHALVVGTAQQREYILRQGALNADLIIVGIDVVDWLIGQLGRYGPTEPIFDLLVIDEISKLRNPTGVRAKLLAKHAYRWRNIWGLSGTLRPSSALDLFMPARVVTRGKLWGRSYYQWRQNHFYATDYKGYVWEPKPHAEEQINSEIAPLVVTLQADEYPQLPELTVVIDKVELPEAARKQYDTMHRKLVAKVDDHDVLAATAAVATGKLAQIANGFLYDGEYPDRPTVRTIAVHDEKRAWLEDLIQDVEGPLLLVYNYLEDLRMIQDVCGPMPYLGHNVTDAGSDAAIRAWNSGRLRFMAMHPASGGHGLNLQAGGADMAWISPPWSPEQWEQSIARLHRPGQGRHVMVRVCAATNTVDEMKINRVQNRMTAQKAFEQYLRDWGQVRSAHE